MGKIGLEGSHPPISRNLTIVSLYLCICVFVYLCICVIVYLCICVIVYLCICMPDKQDIYFAAKILLLGKIAKQIYFHAPPLCRLGARRLKFAAKQHEKWNLLQYINKKRNMSNIKRNLLQYL